MSNPSVQQFYAVGHEGNFFHEKGPMYGPLGHLGQDYHDWAKGTIIPSWTAGTVAFVSKQPSPTLGYLVIVRRSDGRYAGFCHLNAPSKLALGQHVTVGTPVGPLGMTGSLATGYHLHATLEPQLEIGTANAQDPLPYIHTTLAGLAGGDVKPLPVPPKKKVQDMVIIKNTNPQPVGYRWAAMDGLNFDVLRNPTVPVAVTREQRAWGVALNVSQVEFDQFLAQVNQRRHNAGLAPIVWPTA